MTRVRSMMYLLPELWRTLTSRPATVEYPFAPAEIPPGYRGEVTIDPDACRGCGLCVRDCPGLALTLERQGKGAFTLSYQPDRCAYCGQCEASCIHGAIRLTNNFAKAVFQRDNLNRVLVAREEKTKGQ